MKPDHTHTQACIGQLHGHQSCMAPPACLSHLAPATSAAASHDIHMRAHSTHPFSPRSHLPACLSPLSERNYLLMLEALKLLVVCCSTQLYTSSVAAPQGTHPIMEAIMDQQPAAGPVVTALLKLITQRVPLPARAALYSPEAQSKTGVLQFVRSAAGELRRGTAGLQHYAVQCCADALLAAADDLLVKVTAKSTSWRDMPCMLIIWLHSMCHQHQHLLLQAFHNHPHHTTFMHTTLH